jgi:hypothetical protein
MPKAIAVAVMLSVLLAVLLRNTIERAADRSPQSSDIICATVTVIVGGDPSSPPADQMLHDIRAAWQRHDGDMMTDEELARTMLACVDSPSLTLRDVFLKLTP